ncbi:hypothetical protein DPX16_18645 [Anabarilius grahami]|uniref:Endothelial cell-specific chemotaxis regulator n=1 Tax=Anabarilius grahami TaxID=495550 RepID=A0A3N0YPB5_ANAGA|nr:hypothetical protein DPX16_18645 [Anabarilius grahami]
MTSHTSTTVGTTTALLSSRHTVGAYERPMTSTTVISNISMPEMTATPSQAPDSSLTLLAFGVMSLILILIVVMVILVIAINLRGRCKDTRQHKDTDSPQISSVHSTIVDNEDQELTRDLLGIKDGV